MFFKKRVNRRGFLLSLSTVVGTAYKVCAEMPQLTAGIATVNGTNVFRNTIISPPNTIGTPQTKRSSNGGPWTNNVSSTNNVVDMPATNKVELVKFATVSITLPNGVTYIVPLTSQPTLFVTMKNTETFVPSFTFESDLLALGQFVKKINGTSQGGGSRWFLYVNGQFSQKGASDLVLKASDTIEWSLS